MSGETVEVWGTLKSIESNGASISNGSLIQVSGAYDKAGADGNGFPDAQFVLTASFAVAPVENGLVSLYAREYPQDGSGLRIDAPEATRPGRFIGSFVVNDRAGSQIMVLMGIDLPPKADYYLHNVNTGQAISAGWKLTATPRSYKSAS